MNERTFYYIFYTLGPTVLTTDDTVCDIFLINASCKLFALHHSTSFQPTPLPPPFPRVSRSSPSHRRYANLILLTNTVFYLYTVFSHTPLTIE
jgi:hypothetical protein